MTQEWGIGNGDWGLGIGDWGMRNGEWGVGNGEWRMGIPNRKSEIAKYDAITD